MARVARRAARARPAVLFISDRPERYEAFRDSALAERTVHVWLGDGRRVGRRGRTLRGDPADVATYAPLADRDAIVVVDLSSEQRARRVARAAARAFRLPAVLLIDRQRGHRHASVRNGITWIDEGELLAGAIELVIRRVAVRRRVRGLRHALRGATRCAFLVQNDPDPDAIASALALRRLLGFAPSRAPIITCGGITRPENRRLVEELGVDVRHVTRAELRRLAPLVLVDVQPPYFGRTLSEVAAVLDHHPVSESYRASFRDVRTSYGASATMAAEYLFAESSDLLTKPLATALLYGIMTDTKNLTRAASDEDLEAFAHLFPRADQAMLRRIQHPSYGSAAIQRLGRALERARVTRGLAHIHLGELPPDQEHVVAQFAEFVLGMDGATVAAVSGVFGGRLVVSLRALSPAAQLGRRVHEAFAHYGSAGGHPAMAKMVLPLAAWRRDHAARGSAALERSLRRALQAVLD